MKQPNNLVNIDESIKLYSWEANNNKPPIQQSSPQSHVDIFKQYADSNRNGYTFEKQDNQFQGVEVGFNKLKSQQIQKLRDLRCEYDEIKKIATDYSAPVNASRGSSMISSAESPKKVRNNMESPQNSKVRGVGGGREVQILELEKKQLQMMVENSMKKIEELLHNEMKNKRTIHELRLEKESRANGENGHLYNSKFVKKKEKENNEQIKILQLEREGLLSTMVGLKERVKYLQNMLTVSDNELRKLMDQKRNYEQLLRVEKDKYLNLQLQLKRQKRLFQIDEKDKNAEISSLRKQKNLKEGTVELQLKNNIAALQQDLKIKDTRYTLLLQQFQNYQKEKQQLQINKLSDIAQKTAADPQNKVLQETLVSILQRIGDLEKKPILEIQNIVNHEHESHSQIVVELEKKIQDLSRTVEYKVQENTFLHQQNYDFKAKIQRLEREIKLFKENQTQFEEQLDRLKKKEKTLRRNKSQRFFVDKSGFAISNVQLYELQKKVNHKGLVVQYSISQQQVKSLQSEKQNIQVENRELRMQISKLQFEVQKSQRQKQFEMRLMDQANQLTIDSLQKDINSIKSQLNSTLQQNRNLKFNLAQVTKLRQAQIQKWQSQIITIQKQRRNMDPADRLAKNYQLAKLNEENSQQVKQLTDQINLLTLRNQQQVEMQKVNSTLLSQNEQLRKLVRQVRSITSLSNDLWSRKQQQYSNINNLLRTLSRN